MRKAIKYKGNELKIIQNNNKITLLQIENAELSNLTIFENQIECADNIISGLENRKIVNIMVIAKTQSGKTGSMLALIKEYVKKFLIPIENIYIITGLSSVEWKAQTMDRMPSIISERIFHRNNLANVFSREIPQKENILILMDEIQIAAQKDQTLYNVFGELKLRDINNLYKKDIKIVEFTATPDNTLYDLMTWGKASMKIMMTPGRGYISSFDLLTRNRVKQYKPLWGENAREIMPNIREVVADINSFDEPRYSIIRTGRAQKQTETIKRFKRELKCKTIIYDQSSEMDINDILMDKPTKHTIIFIKEMLRCAKTLHKKYLGVLVDRHCNNIDDTVIIQGLVGRGTGYDDNGDSIFYTNIDSIEKYEILWNSEFTNTDIEWNCKTSFNKTFNTMHTSEILEPTIKKFKTQEEAKAFYQTELKHLFGGRGPNIKTPEDGFYSCAIKGVKKIYNYEEILESKEFESEKFKYKLYPCYKDISNSDSLIWLLIYK